MTPLLEQEFSRKMKEEEGEERKKRKTIKLNYERMNPY